MGKYGWGQLIALPLAWLVYRIGHNIWMGYRRARRTHSPIDAALVLSWISLQVIGDTDPDPDTESAPEKRGPRWLGRRLGRRHVDVDANTTKVEYFDLEEDELPPATPQPNRGNSQLQIWIRRSFEEGARYSDVVRDGKRLFGKSEATIKRAIRDYKKAQARAKAGR